MISFYFSLTYMDPEVKCMGNPRGAKDGISEIKCMGNPRGAKDGISEIKCMVKTIS